MDVASTGDRQIGHVDQNRWHDDLALAFEAVARVGAPAAQTAAEYAQVRVAVPLLPADAATLSGAISHHFGKTLALRIETDPSILGGIWLRVGDIVIDGSLFGKLEALRHHLRTHCRTMLSSATLSTATEVAPK